MLAIGMTSLIGHTLHEGVDLVVDLGHLVMITQVNEKGRMKCTKLLLQIKVYLPIMS